MIITKDFIEQHKTVNGAWTRQQLFVLGIQWPPRHGWMRSVIGRELTPEQVAAFIAAREIICHKSKRKSKKQTVANRFEYPD
jgi:hypothetical protein